MGILQPYQIDHPETRERWEQRYGDDPNSPAENPYDAFIKQGLSSDEAWEAFLALLEKNGAAAKARPDGFFSKRDHLVNAAMDDLRKYREANPNSAKRF